MQVRISSWNVNSIRSRITHVTNWLQDSAPDVVLLQELKCEEHNFPKEQIEELGYNIAMFGQKSYNGVAILSKYPLEDIVLGLKGHNPDESRYIEAIISLPGSAIRVASVYVPNGQEVGSDKFQSKLHFFDCLYEYSQKLLSHDEITLIGGDFNVALEDIDVYSPKALEGNLCFHIEERKRMRAILNNGFFDSFRLKSPEATEFSWWDYRAGAWQNNYGLRIDYNLISPKAADLMHSTFMEKNKRAEEKASDHVPVTTILTIN